jgi:CRISPR-associated protein Csb2
MVAATIDALCADVGYLGTADSPVLLRVGDAEPSHELDPSASVFSGGGIDVAVPTPGRFAALETVHRRDALPIPAVGADKVSSDEAERHLGSVIDGITTMRFARRVEPTTTGHYAPWDRAVVVPIDAATHPDNRVARAVAMHRALISIIGDDAPPLITGHYLDDVPVPANRLAIQFIQHDDPTSFSLSSAGAVVLLIPADAREGDLAVLDEALRSMSTIRTRSKLIRVTGRPWVEDASAFWRPVAPGHHRAWVTDPVAIPESLPVRGRRWTLDEAALLSVGFVFRDELGERRRGREGYMELIDVVTSRGVRVLASQLAHRPDGGRFVHRVRKETVVQPYRVSLDLGTLHPADGVLAIGQSRHLGGGFLRPIDVPSEGRIQ